MRQLPISLPQSAVIRGGIVSLEPIAPHLDGTWQNGANISENHHENHPQKGRQLGNRGIGNSRMIVCAQQCGFSPKELFAKAKCGKGSLQAKQQRC
jgi:hypothetical protein